jgi:hypothetical protein
MKCIEVPSNGEFKITFKIKIGVNKSIDVNDYIVTLVDGKAEVLYLNFVIAALANKPDIIIKHIGKSSAEVQSIEFLAEEFGIPEKFSIAFTYTVDGNTRTIPIEADLSKIDLKVDGNCNFIGICNCCKYSPVIAINVTCKLIKGEKKFIMAGFTIYNNRTLACKLLEIE